MTGRMEVSETMGRALADPAGLPSLAVPRGFAAGGLPVGMKVIGRTFDEAALFRIGAAYQRSTGFHEQAPSL